MRKKNFKGHAIVSRLNAASSSEVKSRPYVSLVRPKLEYASSTWDPHTKRNIDEIEMVQSHAATFVWNDYLRYRGVSSMINSLGWHLHQFHMFHKFKYGTVGIKLLPEVQPLSRHTRLPNPHPHSHLQCTVDSLKVSFHPRVIPVWNNLTFLADQTNFNYVAAINTIKLFF